MCLVVATGGEIGIRRQSSDVPSFYSPIHGCIENWLGCASTGPDCNGVCTDGQLNLHINILEMKVVQLAMTAFRD